MQTANMNPQEDWVALDFLSEKEAKVLLRMAVANARAIAGTVENPLDNKSYTQNGHALAAGFSLGFLMNWERHYHANKPQEVQERRN